MNTREEFFENEIRTLNHHIQSMIDTMKVMSMNKQNMSNEIERLKSEVETAVKDEREACIKLIEDFSKTTMVPVRDTWVMGLIAGANALRARGRDE
jgi:ElaB/YqjD/DUF883 family membrane-anchored ribosome-binding protein